MAGQRDNLSEGVNCGEVLVRENKRALMGELLQATLPGCPHTWRRGSSHLLNARRPLPPSPALQITQLKIASNPFAKGFRDCDPEDW